MPSFSVRCLFRWLGTPEGSPRTYEERITLWSARDIHESIALAEAEAQSYAAESECEYLGYCQAYAMSAQVSASAVEVFSLLRDSQLAPTEYINTLFATGTERQSDA
jgi:hypothetical protein